MFGGGVRGRSCPVKDMQTSQNKVSRNSFLGSKAAIWCGCCNRHCLRSGKLTTEVWGDQGLVMRVLTYGCLLQYCARPNMGNPLHRIFTYFWSHVLDKSRRIRSLATPQPAGINAPRDARPQDDDRTTPLLGEAPDE